MIIVCFLHQLLKEATESRHKCEQMKQQEAQLKQQVNYFKVCVFTALKLQLDVYLSVSEEDT